MIDSYRIWDNNPLISEFPYVKAIEIEISNVNIYFNREYYLYRFVVNKLWDVIFDRFIRKKYINYSITLYHFDIDVMVFHGVNMNHLHMEDCRIQKTISYGTLCNCRSSMDNVLIDRSNMPFKKDDSEYCLSYMRALYV